MSLSGNELDLAVRKYTDMIDAQLQQKGSVLDAVCTIESGVMGERTYFNRIGAIDSIEELSDRFDPITLDQASFERRYVTPQFLHKAIGLDKLDLVRMASSPESEVVQQMVYGIGRAKDKVILNAMGGTALREVAGAGSNVTFDSNQTIAVSDNTYTTLTGSNSLHEGKVLKMVKALQEAHVDTTAEQVFIIASASQLAYLKSRILTTGVGRRDFFDKAPLAIPGLDKSLDGLHGCRFIAYQTLADTDQLSSSNEYVYALVKSAIKVGVWEPLTVDITERKDLKRFPVQMTVATTIGAVRMDEKRIVRALCTVT